MSKIVYIIPGFSQTVKIKGYPQIIELFEARHFKVIPIKITWKHHLMSDYLNEFWSQLNHNKKDKVYLFGFSFGSMIAFLSAHKIKPEKLILCSLSPYFKEDLKYLKKSWIKWAGKRRLNELKGLGFNEFAKKIKCQTLLLVGDKEGKEMEIKIKDAQRRIKYSQSVFIKNAKHDISQKEYLDKLKGIINSEF